MKENIAVIGSIICVVVMAWVLLTVKQERVGSVVAGNDYSATTTKNVAGTTLTDRVLKSTGGVVSQITITGAAAGQMTLCNATTSDVTKRASSLATSSLLCINVPASTAAGTYTYDAEFPTGIILDTESTAPTSTIMFR